MWNKLKQGVVEQVFMREFEAYNMPFQRIDDKIMRMSEGERAEYLIGARTWIENKTFNAEIDEAMRKFYAELALKSGNVAEVQAYRLTIKFMKDFKKRAAFLAASYHEPRMPSQFKK
jgi:hypothetical protein